jgi:hypothetical protein
MSKIQPDSFDWYTLIFFCLITVMLLYEAWVNIILKKVSKYSIDALLVILARKFGTRKTKKNAFVFPRNKLEIVILGIWALLAGLKGIQEIINWFSKYSVW